VIAFAGFSFRRALQGIRSNKLMSAAATATIVLMLALLSGLVILLAGFDATLKYVEQEVQVVAYLKDSATSQQIASVQAGLGQMPQVAQVSYVSSAQALADFLSRHPDEAEVVNSLPTNPLPASLQINLRDPNDYPDVADFLMAQPGVDRVLNIRQTVDQLVSIIGVLRAVGLAILLVVGLIVLFIIVNTIRQAVLSRADEIEIMRLVGASDAFIRWPFILEGCLMGLAAALVTVALLWVGQAPIASFMADYFKVLPVEASATIGRDVALVVLATGVGMGFLGSWLSVRSCLAR
jgi:cell division transport system permease protein